MSTSIGKDQLAMENSCWKAIDEVATADDHRTRCSGLYKEEILSAT